MVVEQRTEQQQTSRRSELLYFTETGRLRDSVSGELGDAAADLLVDIVLRYCEPRRKRRRK